MRVPRVVPAVGTQARRWSSLWSRHQLHARLSTPRKPAVLSGFRFRPAGWRSCVYLDLSMRRLVIILVLASAAALNIGSSSQPDQQQQQPSQAPPQPERGGAEPREASQAAAADDACEAAAPGTVLSGLDDEQTPRAPYGLEFLRVTTGECRRCLKSCLGGKISNAQMTFMKIQAPFSLLTWYLFKNRPFTMIPLEKALGKLFGVPAAIYGGGAVGAYLSCRPLCDLDCPYPGGSPQPEEMPELESADPTDLRFLHRLYNRGGRRGGGGGGGGFSQALSDMFRM